MTRLSPTPLDAFRTRPIKPEEPAVLFVTKCPCDECVPLIRGAGIAHIYTSDQDRGKDKGDISYLRFGGLRSIGKFVVSEAPRRPGAVAEGSGRKVMLFPLLFTVAEESCGCPGVAPPPRQ